MSKEKWWTTPRRVIQPVLRLADHSIDTNKMVDEIKATGANTILLNVGCIYAFYPTKQPYLHTVPGLERDIFGEVVERARFHDMKVMGRFDLSSLHRDAYEDHPEWFYVSRQGKPLIDSGTFATCPSGSFFDDFFFPIFDEVWDRYHIDGVFFNMFGYRERNRQGIYHGPCHCVRCQQVFEERYNTPLPACEDYNNPVYYKYLEFREEMYDIMGRKIYSFLKQKSADIGIFEGRRNRSPIRMLDITEGVCAVETHWTLMIPHPEQVGQIHSQAMKGGKIWRYTPGETGRMVRTFGEGYATAINLFHAGGGRFEAHSKGWMGMGLLQAAANDAWPYIAFIGTPWLEDKKTKPLVQQIYSFLADHEDLFTGLVSGAQVAIVQSENNSKPRFGRPDPGQGTLAPYRGWYSLLVKAHIEFDIIDELQIERNPNILDKYKLLILPNVALLDEPVCTVIDKYVEIGGALIATYETSLYDHQGKSRGSFGLSCLGVDKVLAERKNLFNAYFRNDASKKLPGITDTSLIYMNGGYVYGRLKSGAETTLKLTNPIEYSAPEFEVIEVTSQSPGIIWHSYGRGKTAYLPWEIDTLVFNLGLEDHIQLLKDLIYSLAPPQGFDFQVDAPSWIEATLHHQTKTGYSILQFVNESGQDGVEFHEPVVVHDVCFRLYLGDSSKIRSVRSIWNGQDLEYSLQNGWLVCKLQPLKLYDLVLVNVEKV